MVRRLHTPQLRVGDIILDAVQARHARDVLRLAAGETVELFDDHGAVATGVLAFNSPREVLVRVRQISLEQNGPKWTIASAVPKGERADWMIEKLSELGAAAFIPLIASRSVVVPQGKNKLDRWARISTESAKQSRRRGVMRIEEPTPLDELLKNCPREVSVICLSTAPTAVPILSALQRDTPANELLLLIGPEGGWTDAELETINSDRGVEVQLTTTVLRVETAAIAAGAIVASILARKDSTNASEQPHP